MAAALAAATRGGTSLVGDTGFCALCATTATEYSVSGVSPPTYVSVVFPSTSLVATGSPLTETVTV